jgi:hypothetical protein
MKAFALSALVFSLAACDGGVPPTSTPCEYPQTRPAGTANDSRCPAVYGGDAQNDLCAGGFAPCDAPNLNCSYYGVGDGRPGCYAIAVMFCASPQNEDADAGSVDGGAQTVWRCAH